MSYFYTAPQVILDIVDDYVTSMQRWDTFLGTVELHVRSLEGEFLSGINQAVFKQWRDAETDIDQAMVIAGQMERNVPHWWFNNGHRTDLFHHALTYMTCINDAEADAMQSSNYMTPMLTAWCVYASHPVLNRLAWPKGTKET